MTAKEAEIQNFPNIARNMIAAGMGTGKRPSLCQVMVHVIMMTSSNGNIFLVTGPLSGEFPAQRPVTRSFEAFFNLFLNKRLSKQS